MESLFAWANAHPTAFTVLAFPVVLSVCIVFLILIYVGVHWLLG